MALPLLHLHHRHTARHAPAENALNAVLLHRLSVGRTAQDAVGAFELIPELRDAFGGKFPYHFVVDAAGDVTQTLPLSRQGLHALSWNANAVGVACLGDFTRAAPPWAQWRSALLLCGLLAYPQGWDVLGHTEAHRRGPDATSDAGKECPGPKWDMTSFRDEIRELSIAEADVNTFWKRVRLG